MTFAISHTIPGDPARLAAGLEANAEQVEAMRHRLGLDRPLPEQYLNYITSLATGDFGESIHSKRPVLDDLVSYLPATLELTLFAASLAALIAIPLGILSATQRGILDYAARTVALVGSATPVFWSGLVLLLIVYKELGWLPGGGRFPSDLSPPDTITGLYVVDSLLHLDVASAGAAMRHLILPGFVLSQVMLGPLARMTRSSMLEVLREDYIRTARAKGLRSPTIVYRHAMKNAFIPVVTLFGLQFGHLLSGAILTEAIFSWPGVGSYALQSVYTLDFPAIMGITLVVSLMYVLINMLVDVAYAFLDPRIRY